MAPTDQRASSSHCTPAARVPAAESNSLGNCGLNCNCMEWWQQQQHDLPRQPDGRAPCSKSFFSFPSVNSHQVDFQLQTSNQTLHFSFPTFKVRVGTLPGITGVVTRTPEDQRNKHQMETNPHFCNAEQFGYGSLYWELLLVLCWGVGFFVLNSP